MKRTTAFLLAMLLAGWCLFALWGCGKSVEERDREIARATPVEGIRPKGNGAAYWQGLDGADEPGGINQPVWVTVDWVFYPNAGELIDAATDIFCGRVKGVSFAVGPGLSPSDGAMLYTVYTVDVTETCKGSADGTVEVRMPGGIGVRLREQDAIRREAGLRPVILDNVELEVGETYLFCTRAEGAFYGNLGMWQFVYPVGSDGAAVIRRACAGKP